MRKKKGEEKRAEVDAIARRAPSLATTNGTAAIPNLLRSKRLRYRPEVRSQCATLHCVHWVSRRRRRRSRAPRGPGRGANALQRTFFLVECERGSEERRRRSKEKTNFFPLLSFFYFLVLFTK